MKNQNLINFLKEKFNQFTSFFTKLKRIKELFGLNLTRKLNLPLAYFFLDLTNLRLIF